MYNCDIGDYDKMDGNTTKPRQDEEPTALTTEPGRTYMEYPIGHLANIVSAARDMLKDVLYSIGLSKTSETTLIRDSLMHMDFLGRILEDSKENLKDIKFKAYNEDDGPGDRAEAR